MFEFINLFSCYIIP